MINYAIFLAIFFTTNIIQGITGFAGTVLAVPFCSFFINLFWAIAVMNMLGIVTSIHILSTVRGSLRLDVMKRALLVMGPGLLTGFAVVQYLREYETAQRFVLGLFVVAVGLANLLGRRLNLRLRGGALSQNLLLFFGGLFHGMYVCGGPLLVAYLTGKLRDKSEFRATISSIWLPLNFLNLADHIRNGYVNSTTLALTAIGVPVVFISVHIGTVLVKRMSQDFFIKLTNVLLVISGLSLIVRP